MIKKQGSKRPIQKKLGFNKELLKSILGHPGALCSWSKSCGPAMAVYNSNIVIIDGKKDPYVAWYGDIVVNPTMVRVLCKFAIYYNVEIQVFHESPVRQFVFDKKDESKCSKEQLKAIKAKSGFVWSTATPDMWGDMPYAEAEELRELRTAENIKDRLIGCKILTPRGTKWTWYNTWFYKSIWAFGAKISDIYHVFIQWPYETTKYHTEMDLKDKIKKFFHSFKKEIWYQRQEGGLLHFGPFKYSPTKEDKEW